MVKMPVYRDFSNYSFRPAPNPRTGGPAAGRRGLHWGWM